MKKYTLLAVAVISLTACSTEDTLTEEPVAAKICANIGESSLTRARDVSWDKGDAIGVSMSGRYSNIKYTTQNGDGVFDGQPMYFKNKVEPVTLTAYYPFTGTEGETPEIIEATTEAARQTEDEQPKFDFLFDVKENVTGTQPDVTFSFAHMMSKLTLTFINGNLGTDVTKITSCEITGLALEGTFNHATGECAVKTDAPSATLAISPTVTDDKVSLSLILFPQTVANVTMKITDRENQEYGCELRFDGNRLVSGDHYLYTIKVNKTELNIEDFTISDWIEKTDESEAKSE